MKITLLIISLLAISLKFFCQLTNGAMHFDGTDYINANGSYSPGTGNITIEVWVKLDTLPMSAYPILSSRNNNGTVGFALWATPFGIVSAYFGHQQVTGGSLGTCFEHIAIVRENYVTKIYLGGSLNHTSTDTMIENVNSNTPLYFGYDVAGLSYYKGWLKEIRIWNSARTDSEIANNMNTPLTGNLPDLVGYWRLDDTSQVILDYSSAHNNATGFGATPISTVSVCGLPVGTSIQEYEKSFFISENSADNCWVLNQTGYSKIISFSLYNIEGKLIYERNYFIDKDISFGQDLSPGIYIAKIATDSGEQNFKLIKR